jgi:hypothetical protein
LTEQNLIRFDDVLQSLQSPSPNTAAQLFRKYQIRVQLLEIGTFIYPVLSRGVPVVDLETNKYSDNDHQHFDDDNEPVLLGKGFSESAQ